MSADDRVDLPVLDQVLPDDFPHDLRADAEQLGDGGVVVVEAIQQNLWHLFLLLPYEPENKKNTVKFGFKGRVNEMSLIHAFFSP